MDNRCVGVFDSGLGGLTAVRALMEYAPTESIVYFGDTGRVPYGSRTKETIIRYVEDDIKFLLTQNPKVILAACGTASAVALDCLPQYSVPIIGVVEPTAKAAVAATKNGKIGVIGTTATINSAKYERAIKKLQPTVEITSVSCPLFVPLVENGHTHSQAARLIAEEYLSCLKKAGVDTIILGCTHYPLLFDIISDIMGSVCLISSGEQSALEVAQYIKQNSLNSTNPPIYSYYVSDNASGFSKLGSIFLKSQIQQQCQTVYFETEMNR